MRWCPPPWAFPEYEAIIQISCQWFGKFFFYVVDVLLPIISYRFSSKYARESYVGAILDPIPVPSV